MLSETRLPLFLPFNLQPAKHPQLSRSIPVPNSIGHWRIPHIYTSIGEGNGNPLQYSCLENPMGGGAWWAAVHGVTQSRTRLKRLSSSSSIRLLVGVLEHMKEAEPKNSEVRACNPSLMYSWVHSFRNPSSTGSSTHDFGVLNVGAPVGTGNWEAVAVGPRTRSLQRRTYPKTCPTVCNGRAQDTYNTQHGGDDSQPCSPPIIILLPEHSLCLRGSQTRGRAHHPHDTAGPTEAKQ